MRLAEDRRARVPFALVGVLLLVGSAGLSATLAGGPSPRTDESVGLALDRTTSTTNTAVRDAVARAGRQAASEPVTVTANTSAGRGLNDSATYRDYLRIRIYLAAREALDSVAVRVGGVSGSVSLPATPNASALRQAKRRVELAPAGRADRAGLRVRIENVTVTATRDGRVLAREDIAPTVVVATPALALHERVERFESRLNRGPLDPGLGRRLTARLYAVAWARGYAQFGRAPIENVVANRHVELATNGAMLREQRVAFGRSDPAGRRAVRWATARVGAKDLLTAADVRYGSSGTGALLDAADRYQQANPMPGGVATDGDGTETAASSARVQAGVNRTADRAFVDLVTGENGTGLADVLRSAYTVDVRLVTASSPTAAESRPTPVPPGPNWWLRETTVRTTSRVERASGPPPETPNGWHLLDHETRRVVRTHALVANWTSGNDSRQTVQRWSETVRVRVGVAGDHSANGPVTPGRPRPVAGVHERGGALGGPNLRDVSATAVDRLVADSGGFDAVARRAVVGTLDARRRTVVGQRPPDLREWVYRDLATLRDRVRNVSVTVPATAALDDGGAATELARAIRARRGELIDAPSRYDGVADRARVATRAAYLDRVLGRLDARAARANATRTGIDAVLADAGTSLGRVREVLRARGVSGSPPLRPMPADGPGRASTLRVSGSPPYLTLAALDHEQVRAIPAGETTHPLAARNVNLFAVPYGDAADAVTSTVVGSGETGRTDLRTAALALRAANRTLAEEANRTLERRRDALRGSLAESMRTVRQRLVAQLGAGRFDLTRAERRAAVRSGLARWETTHGRTLAVANGSGARAIATAVVRRRPPLRQADRRDWVRLRTELAVESARQEVDGPTGSLVNRATSATRSVAESALNSALADGLGDATEAASKRWFGEVLGAVPAGLPVAPVPGHWYATLNVWTVSVRGHYARFAVSAPQGPPGESVTYVREAGEVRVDWDGDGERELVGTSAPVAFETETVVAVVVPPGPPGVGDRDGQREEASSGWSAE